MSGSPKFFAGTDSAPHAQNNKENACGCAGIYSAPYAVEFYAQIFDGINQLNKLNNFLSYFGAEFYHVPINTTQLVLYKKTQQIAYSLPFGADKIIPLAAGTTLNWTVNERL